ncbi:DNA methyltransferase [Micromonospora sp. NPDC048887]|uniref:DNA methyltransferase n=1 Tax=Micromonospora sp. NPDC048887 TaxID=3155614 RepID=UPI0033C0B6C6
MSNPSPNVLRQALDNFVRYRREYLSGDEKGEAQVFCDRLFQAFGHEGVKEAGATLEMRLKKNNSRGTAFADLMWKPRCLIEMKKSGTDLSKHYRQAFDYWIMAVPDRPRYVILCNFDELWVYDFDSQLDAPVDRISLEALPKRHDALSFLLPIESKPIFHNDLVAVTRGAARMVAALFRGLHDRGVERTVAQRFVLQSVMGMFAEDIGLLPGKYFTRALEDASNGASAYDLLFGLFREMNTPGSTKGGRYIGTPYFNGGLFANISPIELTNAELSMLRDAAATDWSAVRPEIFGTLFEGSMDAGERHAQGAHFTSQTDIASVVIPTIVTPWRDRLNKVSSIAEIEKLLAEMFSYRVLDPACGSGNFLYVAYREMRRLEREALDMINERRRSSEIAAQSRLAYVAPDNFHGIDNNAFAVEIAKVTMMLAKKLAADEFGDAQQVLPLDNLDNTIVHADALFSPWPQVDAIIGNPPFVARRDMAGELGSDYTQRLARAYPQIGGVSNFVTYWFQKSHDHLPDQRRAGLVATAAIRENDSRKASLDYIVDNDGVIVEAVSSKPWSGDAAVHISIVNWTKGIDPGKKKLWISNGELYLETDYISSSLSSRVDVRHAKALPKNQRPQLCFQGQTPGITKGIGYILDTPTAVSLVRKDPGSEDVIFPFLGGNEMLDKPVIDRWVIDVSTDDVLDARTSAAGAMSYLEENVLPKRQALVEREKAANESGVAKDAAFKPELQHQRFMSRWWHLWRRRSDMLTAIQQSDRYIATSRHATQNRMTVFVFVSADVHPGDALSVFALDDDYSFGILSSSIHRTWLDARCSTFKGDPRYTPTTVWDSFPWPQSPTRQDVDSIVKAVEDIIAVRSKFLERGVSLSSQYDSLRRPGKNVLREAHVALDAAVIKAYQLDPNEDTLTQLLALNQTLAADPDAARGPGPSGLDGCRSTDYRLEAPTLS